MGPIKGVFLDPSDWIFKLVLTFILVFLNAFFVVSEFAIVKVRRTRLEELSRSPSSRSKSTFLALNITNQLDSYLSATQLGITFSSLGLGWVGEPAVAYILRIWLEPVIGSEILLHSLSFIIAFTLITLLHVVLGEIVPKSIAIAKAEKCVLFVAKPLYLFRLFFYPVICLFDLLANLFLRIFKIRIKYDDSMHSEEELKIIVDEGLKGGLIDSIEGKIIKNAVDFSDTIAKEIMTPRKDMVALNSDSSYDENMSVVMKTHHTRYPYYQGSKDNILGMIHIRDLLESVFIQKEVDLKKILRQMLIVPESASIAQILTKMNKQQIHTALVVDEYGGTAGLLTMEDIIEEIMGDISDEHDDRSVSGWERVDEHTILVDGMLDLESIEEILGVDFDDHAEQVTIGGYVFALIGRLPVVGDVIQDDLHEFKVSEVDGARIKRLYIRILKESNPKISSLQEE